MQHVNKRPLVKKMKFGLNKKTRPRMNNEWIDKTIKKKNPIQKTEKTVKIEVKLPHVNKKSLARKRILFSKHRFLTPL